MSTPATENVLDYQAYVTQQQVLSWMQMDQSDLGSSGDDLNTNMQLLIASSCDWVQDTLGRPIAPTPVFRRFDGWSSWNGAYIELPYYPIVSVDAVTEWWGTGGPHLLSECTPDNQGDGYQIDRLTGRLTRVFPGNVQKPWFPGSKNIEVAWTAGYANVPPRILMGTLELITYWWRNKQQQPAWTQGGYQGYDQNSVGPGHSSFLEGTPSEIIDTLFPTQQVGIG